MTPSFMTPDSILYIAVKLSVLALVLLLWFVASSSPAV
jgi:hypothetical protein